MNNLKLFWSFLDNNQKIYFFYIVFLMIIQAVLEIFSIALLIPFTALILDPSQETNLLIFDNLNFLKNLKHFSSFYPIFLFV